MTPEARVKGSWKERVLEVWEMRLLVLKWFELHSGPENSICFLACFGDVGFEP